MMASRSLLVLAAGFFVLVGTTVIVSIAVGGWTLWSHLHATAEPQQSSRIAESAPQPREPEKRHSTAERPDSPAVLTTASDPEPKAGSSKKPTGRDHQRQEALLESLAQRLHGEAYEHFIRQPGMGESRLKPLVTVVKREWKMPDWTSEELAKTPPPLAGMKDLDLIHRFSVRNFGESNTMTQDERWAAYAKNPPAQKENLWEIKSLDLIGLVMHETPVVYMSETLPQMKELRRSPTREMDLFESEGLEELLSGKPLYVRAKQDTIRVLGPIQAGKACLKCHHDAREGTMLGAFSYTLREGEYMMRGRSSKAKGPVKAIP